jgi:hypothetical protein
VTFIDLKSSNTDIFKPDGTNSYIIFEVIFCRKGLFTGLFVKILADGNTQRRATRAPLATSDQYGCGG